MRKAHEKVIKAFMEGKPAHDKVPTTYMGGDRGTVSRLHTDGKILYSYRMAIAKRSKTGRYVLVKRSECPSNTTRSHLQSLVTALYINEELATERKQVAPDFSGFMFAMPKERKNKSKVARAGRKPTYGPCLKCGKDMEYGDELPEERCCDECRRKPAEDWREDR